MGGTSEGMMHDRRPPEAGGEQRDQPEAPDLWRLIVLEPDEAAAAQMRRELRASQKTSSPDPRLEWAFVRSLTELMRLDITEFDLAMVAMELEENTGMDAMAYISAAHSTLATVLYARHRDERIIREAILSGALDCIERTRDFEKRFMSHVRTAIARFEAHRRIELVRRRVYTAMRRMTDKLARLQYRVSQLEALAVTDELTGLHNRRFMNQALEDLWRGTKREARSLGCMIIDVDRFKNINDNFGHQSGDAALYVLGQVLRDNCRRTDVLTRYGGDEFCVLMPDITLEQAGEIARRIEHAFEHAVRALLQDEEGFAPGLSIGISITDLSRPRSAMQLIAHADEAMYAAKRCGGSSRMRGPDGMIAA